MRNKDSTLDGSAFSCGAHTHLVVCPTVHTFYLLWHQITILCASHWAYGVEVEVKLINSLASYVQRRDPAPEPFLNLSASFYTMGAGEMA